mmetsp:Transcript_7754/g.10169  ORF Transcript_7754/g.10169 Transcript_7754/m.10169 type:complete len:280 (-) Transcript_7754:239-1078(-)|eukprot:CAMPEP_0198146158 /NCGR_PEP_ID=MMETSP1443-20131203/27781_1 /TAXON_ID=186043 /ORGANISM="Entomoneis sp., Strain CCMP2396" /LENGTH=279 /DNA_ID=CAMNT_0043810019 /DNA_START=120 /DNA_END=959 /DNA_ORIENTATION=-
MMKALFLLVLLVHADAIQLTTNAKTKLSARAMQDFLSRPGNWPDIVASSNRVENKNPSLPLREGMRVKEYFGLNTLSVEWICREDKPGVFVVESPGGVEGIADQCFMRFNVKDNQVQLQMEYNPLSLIALLATPVLIVDNWIALNVLLPAAVDPFPLDSFRKLMGSLYGVAGLAHFADMVFGDSLLFQTAGLPLYDDLAIPGKAFAWLWCAAGPFSFWATQQSKLVWLPDFSLILYGLIEVAGVVVGAGNSEAVSNAVVVQAIVLAAWFYSSRKESYRP